MPSYRRTGLVALLLALLGAALYLPRLGASGLWDPWEPKYAQAPREMAERGEWIVPWFHDEPRLNKPPLTYWSIGAAQRVLGVNETAARLPSALWAVLGAVALGTALALRRGAWVGFLAGAALLTMPQWTLLGRFATPDMPLASCLALALSAVIALPALEDARARRLAGAAAVLALALAALTEWPRGLLLPAWAVLAWGALRLRWRWSLALAAASLAYFVAQHRYSLPLNLAVAAFVVGCAAAVGRYELGVSRRTLLVAIAVPAVLVLPWLVAAHERQPDEMSLFKYKHAFNLGESPRLHRAPPDYPARIVALGGLPWSAAALAGLLLAFRRREPPDDLARLLGGAVLGPLLFFALAEAKMGHFYGVMQPAVAGLAALGIAAFLRRADWRWVPAVAFAAALAAIAWRGPEHVLETATVKRGLYGFELTLPAALAIAAWAVALALAKLARRPAAGVVSVLPAALLSLWIGAGLVPALSPHKSMKHLWDAYLAARAPGEAIAMTGSVKYGCFYYSDNAILELDSRADVERFLAAGGRWLILPAKLFRQGFDDAPQAFGDWEPVEDTHPTHLLARGADRNVGGRAAADDLDDE